MLAVLLPSCSHRPVAQFLMPTPELYRDGRVKPFDHLPAADRSTDLEVFYATNRSPMGDSYGPGLDHTLRFGVATMRFGGKDETWRSLEQASTTHPRRHPIGLELEKHREISTDEDPQALKRWACEIDRSLGRMDPPDIVMYVHGARVGFLHSCAFAAELGHFSGRDLTAVAFDWPAHWEVFSYLTRVDLRHAEKSAPRLAEMIRVLADETKVRRIHVVSWSAGARVLTAAMGQLAAGTDHATARRRYRLGHLIYAASDVPEREFLRHLPAIHGLSDRVIVYLSDDDGALRWASRLMGGGRRLGLAPETLSPQEKLALEHMPRLEVVDTSYDKSQRGFDITGHRYWFQHPWVNSDVVLAIRTDAPAARRGLRAAPQKGVFYFGGDYADQIGKVGRKLTGGEW
jgi:esterase/lipase superfamily enzyme